MSPQPEIQTADTLLTNPIDLRGRAIDVERLSSELTAAGIAHRSLGVSGAGKLHTYTSTGMPLDLPPSAQAIVDAHVYTPPALPDFGTDLPTDFLTQAADVVTQLRAYLVLPTPTAAQSTTALKLVIRVVFFLLARLVRR